MWSYCFVRGWLLRYNYLHAAKILVSSSENVCIRSPSGDTDIFVIALGLIEDRQRVKFDYGNETNGKEIWLDEIKLPDNHLKTLIGLHAFTGNDYVPAFFRKRKIQCWKTMLKEENFVDMFSQLGNEWDLDDGLKNNLERYVCSLYGSKETNVKLTRLCLFEQSKRKELSLICLISHHVVQLFYFRWRGQTMLLNFGKWLGWWMPRHL